MLKSLVHTVVPGSVRTYFRGVRRDRKLQRMLSRRVNLRQRVGNAQFGDWVTLDNFQLRVTDGPNCYIQYKDLFERQIYRFEAARPDPLIIDCGSNVGMSLVYFKRLYPQSRVIAFEPDPQIFRLLSENVAANKLSDVTLIEAALGEKEGTVSFDADDSAGGRVDADSGRLQVALDRLSRHLAAEVDFLKLNIEGEELPVLREAAEAGRLRNVRELVVEYHGWPQGEQRLGDILNLLHEQGFRYLVHDFDEETCSTSKPPFRWTPQTTWFCLVYAMRIDEPATPGES